MAAATPRDTVARIAARLRAAGSVFAEDEAEILLAEAARGAALEDLLSRRLAGEPLEYVVGWADFAGVRCAVGPGVFVPRARSELLVDQAARTRPAAARPPSNCVAAPGRSARPSRRAGRT